MVLSWFKGRGEPAAVEDLIARRKYGRALELLRIEFEAGRRDPRLRLRLADVLALSGREKEAVPILLGLADEFALSGLAAKAISVLKKVEKIHPGRADVERRLASLLRDKHRASPQPFAHEPRDATDAAASVARGGLPGASDEIGLEAFAAPREAPATGSGAEAPPPDGEALGSSLMALIEDVLVKTSQPAEPQPPAAATPAVSSPLFDDFDEAELLEVIHGLRLRSFEPGDLVMAAGDSGDSLFVVASGTVKAFVPTADGHKLAREMEEGQFFGEISILAAGQRTATVTAKTRCELLELDRATLDDIAQRRPRVREVMLEICRQRLADDRRRIES